MSTEETTPPEPWRLISQEYGEDLRLFRIRYDRMANPRNDMEFDRLILETPDWVNVVALTTGGQVVTVRQYRFGVASLTLEIPGGVVDRGEESGLAARRELREETGFTAPRWSYLGAVEANPAVQNNLCHHWLAQDASRTHERELDDGEDIQVCVLDSDDVRRRVLEGEIRHSLVVSALCRVFDLRPSAGTGE